MTLFASAIARTSARGSGALGSGMALSRRGMLGMVAGGGALLFTTGLIGVSAAAAATNKPVGGVGVRLCRRPPLPNSRIIPTPTDAAGRLVYTAAEAGDYDVEVVRPDLQRAVNALAAQEMVEATAAAATQRGMVIQGPLAMAPAIVAAERIVIVRFAAGLRVTAPNGQVAVAGNPGVFILSAGPQIFIVNGMAAGGTISASIETVDVSDLVPAAQIAAATVAAGAANARGRADIGAVLFAANSGYRGRMVPNARAGMRVSRRR